MSLSEPGNYPLSSLQKEIWVNQMLHPELPMFNVGGYTRIDGAVNIPVFEQALTHVVQAQQALRIRLNKSESLPTQCFVTVDAVDLVIKDFCGDESAALAWMQQQHTQSIPLYDGDLYRFVLCRISDSHYYWYTKYHYLIADGKTLLLVMTQVAETYNAFLEQKAPPTFNGNYSSYIEEDLRYQASQQCEADLRYWQQKFKHLPEPLLHPKYSKQFEGKNVPSQRNTLTLKRDFFRELQEFAAKQGITVRDLMLGVLYLYFSRINQQDDFIVGVTNLMRRGNAVSSFLHQDREDVAGFFMNITPVACSFGTDLSFLALLQAIQQQSGEDLQHGVIPLGDLNRQAKITQNSSQRHQLFELEVAYIDVEGDANFGGAPAHFNLLSHCYEQYALTVYVEHFHSAGDIPIHFDYNVAFFNETDIQQLISRLEHLLPQILHHPDQKLVDFSIMPTVEQRQILETFNDTQTPYTDNQCIHTLFEEQVRRTPDAIAVVFEGQSHSYDFLNHRANQLARYLEKEGVTTETLVGVCIERSLDMIVAWLGILKAGGAYIPLDPNYPQDRLAYIFDDTELSILLTQDRLTERIPPSQATLIFIDRDWELIANHARENREVTVTADNLAYMIYTSGSTGKPKGAMLAHQGLCNLVENYISVFEMTSQSRILQLVSPGFDVATSDVFMSLCAGATLYLPSQIKDMIGRELVEVLREQAITHLQIPVPVLAVLPTDIPLPDLQTLAVGAEAPSASLVRKWSNNRRLLNVYGPTEATVCVTAMQCQGGDDKPLLGRPMGNIHIYILDENQQLSPIGVPGELCIGGVCLARGYWNRPDLTAEKFIYSDHLDERLYRTGDLACYHADGNLEFLGRIDNQVKIRGYRVELGEIETVLSAHPAVQNCAVVIGETSSDEKLLAAYLIIRAGFKTNDRELQDYLGTKLPEYMIPVAFVVLDEFPLTPHGKTDRKELASRAINNTSHCDFVAPRTHEESQLAEAWREILGLEQVGIHDNFFEKGGDSLSGVSLVALLEKQFNRPFQVSSLFKYPTIATFASQFVDLLEPIQHIQHISGCQTMPLSFSQEDVWLHVQRKPTDTSFNICSSFQLTGQLDKTALQHCFDAITQRHDILRTSFHRQQGELVQIASSDMSEMNIEIVQIESEQLDDEQKQVIVNEWVQKEESIAFDLEEPPLWRIRLLQFNNTSSVLILTFHHIIEDGWSVRVLLKEFSDLYPSFRFGKPSPLEPLSIQYADFAYWQRQFFTSDVLQKRHAYWKQLLATQPSKLSLPTDETDEPVPIRKVYRSDSVPCELSESLTSQLRTLSQQQGSTLSVTLLTAYVAFLSLYGKQKDIVIGAPMSKRNHHQVEPLFGYFSGMSVLRIQWEEDHISFLDLLLLVQKTIPVAMENQDLTMKQLWNQLGLKWSAEQQLLFRTVFNFIPVPRESIQLPDLTITPMSLSRSEMVRDMVIGLWNKDGSGTAIEGFLRYRKDLFNKETAIRMVDNFKALLEQVVINPSRPINALNRSAFAASSETTLQDKNKAPARYSPTDSDLKHAHVSLEK